VIVKSYSCNKIFLVKVLYGASWSDAVQTTVLIAVCEDFLIA
jgi:hypothetical protein